MRVKGGLNFGLFYADEVHFFALAAKEDKIVIGNSFEEAQGVDATLVVVIEQHGSGGHVVHAEIRGAHHQRVIFARRGPTHQ